MWTLTICLLLVLGSFAVILVAVLKMMAAIVTQQGANAAEVVTVTVERLIKPVIDPAPIRQVDSQQTEMFQEPDWMADWEGPETSGT